MHSRSERYQHDYSLAICGVDNLKSYNDIYAHQAGDAALKTVADTLARPWQSGTPGTRSGY